MFSRNDLESVDDSRLTDTRMVEMYAGLYFTEYPQHAFRSPDAEEYIRITRAPRLTDDTGLRFWVAAEWGNDGWRGRREPFFVPYLRGASFETLSESEFNQLVANTSSGLLPKLELPLHSENGFVGAILMYSTKTEFIVSVFAEYDDEFIHLYWDTTS